MIEAARTMAAVGGYDAVQMRDVAVRADVALGTIYRYFSSKDHLLAAVWVDWAAQLSDRIALRPPRGDDTSTRVREVLARATKAIESDPQLTRALIRSILSDDPKVVECHRQTVAHMHAALGWAMLDLDSQTRDRIVQVIQHVWYSSLVAWVSGWTGLDTVGSELATAANLLLGDK
jgi:AcrR family transcriptional regulator